MSQATRRLSDSPYAGDGFGNDLADTFGTIVAASPEQVRAARLYVAGMATDVEDARRLLECLGLGVGS